MPNSFNEIIAHVTAGRRYCFVLMSYHVGYTFFERLRKIVAEGTGFECIRADDLPGAGDDLRAKIHYAIDNSVFVIGDVSEPRPNIYYEIGYAVARNKPVLIIAKEGSDIHTDLHGLEMIRYMDNKDGWQIFDNKLRQHLDIHKESNVSLLRNMILPPNPDSSYIILNPKQPKEDSRFHYHPIERRTYGDYLGLWGIMNAFMSVYGDHVIPEIVSASHADDDLVNWNANLFIIGSPKVNKFTSRLLGMIQNGHNPNWYFKQCSGEESIEDYEMQLIGELPSKHFQTMCNSMEDKNKANNKIDYGLVIRGIHPYFPQRTVLILAGPHSIGTGAACLAATKPQLLREISHSLIGKAEITDRNKTIWVLVKGVNDDSGHLGISGVSLIEAGII